MPMTGDLSPEFARGYPEIANIFDNLHMMHDTISDILVTDLLPTWEDKRKEIYRVTQSYYWASADESNPFIMKNTPEPSKPGSVSNPHSDIKDHL
jgi:hypothetical protein